MKSRKEALNVAEVIRGEVINLPDFSIFGDSNTETREELEAWITALREYAATGNVPEDNDEVSLWITGKSWSALSDYEYE
jgi:hypothetical protein